MSGALIEKPIVPQLVKNIPVSYRIRRFITATKTACRLSYSYPVPNYPARARHPSPLTPILILFYHLLTVIPSGLFFSGFHNASMSALPFHMHCPSHDTSYALHIDSVLLTPTTRGFDDLRTQQLLS